jgi:hypothetical protein
MPPDDEILHQDDVEGVISDKILEDLPTVLPDALDDTIEDALEDLSTQVAVTNVSAPSATYVEAEAGAVVTRLNLVTQVLRDAGLIPT